MDKQIFELIESISVHTNTIKDKDKEIKMYALKLREIMAALPH
jgi:hypothetical protein